MSLFLARASRRVSTNRRFVPVFPVARRYAHFRATPDLAKLIQKEADGKSKDYSSLKAGLISEAPWTNEEVNAVKEIHNEPCGVIEKLAFSAVQAARWSFDKLSGYQHGPVSTSTIIDRIVFLETVAGIPGMVGGSLRHLSSLRNMSEDKGWIKSLLQEAENERMHLMTFLYLKQPSFLFKMCVLGAQGVMWNAFFLMYLASPRMAHKFVAFLEEEAVVTYTSIIDRIDRGENADLAAMRVPDIARGYWNMADDCTMRDLMLQIRADEAHHRHANHTFGSISPTAPNPFNHGFPKLTEIQYDGATGESKK